MAALEFQQCCLLQMAALEFQKCRLLQMAALEFQQCCLLQMPALEFERRGNTSNTFTYSCKKREHVTSTADEIRGLL